MKANSPASSAVPATLNLDISMAVSGKKLSLPETILYRLTLYNIVIRSVAFVYGIAVNVKHFPAKLTLAALFCIGAGEATVVVHVGVDIVTAFVDAFSSLCRNISDSEFYQR
jgi:hypothetical protein